MLKIINATVSHELRNPLNSLIAQNIEKQYLYENMKKIIETIPDCNQKDKLNEIIAQLKYGSKVQDQSASIMKFLIQDLLDYSQIKAGKFRKNIQRFDINEAFEDILMLFDKKA